MLNEALQKLRRNPSSVVDQSLSLIDHTDYTNAAGSSIITNPSISPPTTLVALKHHSVHHHSSAGGSGGSSNPRQQSQQKQHHHIQHLSGEKRGLSDNGGGASSTGVSPAKRSKSSASTVTARNTTSGSTSAVSADSIAPTPSDPPFFDIHEKLRQLYALLYLNDRQNELHETRVSYISNLSA